MKKIIALMISAMIIMAANPLSAKNLWAFLSYATFNSPEGPYIETYLAVAANSVRFVKDENGKFHATVNVLMTFKEGNEIKAFKKYELNSNELSDTLNLDFNFLDLQRIAIPNGTYEFEIQLSDKNKTVPAVPYTQTVIVDYPAEQPSISGIELVRSFTKTENASRLTKSGYDLVPFTYTFYPATESKMIFYCELYNLDKSLGAGQKFMLSYFFESFESNLRLNEFSRVKKEEARPVNILLTEIGIENLASGNYNLVVEARNQKNELVASRKLFFQRINPNIVISISDIQSTETANTFVEKLTNTDSIREYINSTYPVATGLEKAFIRENLKKADLKIMRQFLFNFWMQRDPVNTEQSFKNYNDLVYKVNVNFGTPVQKGYQTDRGRVYLEYGPPNTRSTQYNEPSNYPYEIWQYYTLNNNQRNRKFVFYSPDMVTSDFILLHSDAKGEINNPRWQIDLRNRIYTTLDLQDTQVINAWGDMQDDYWELPN